MREPIGKGYLGVMPGTEVYRSCPNAFEPAIATIALDQVGLHQDAELGYRVNWDLQAANGDWSEPGGWAHLMWGGAGYKAWAVFEDSLAYCAALILNRQEEAKELKGIYERSKSDLITAMERGAITNSDGTRRLSSLPGKNSGSCWGLLSAIFPSSLFASR